MLFNMNVNRKNHEIFFIDYLEGNLDPSQERELMVFLEGNPDLKEELDLLRNTTIRPDDSIAFPEKEELKKEYIPVGDIDPENIDIRLLDLLEGNSSVAGAGETRAFLELNPGFKRDWNIFEETRLMPDHSVVFPGKSRLKKRPLVVYLKTTGLAAASVAALLLITLGLFRIFSPSVDSEILNASSRIAPVTLEPVKVKSLATANPVLKIGAGVRDTGFEPGLAVEVPVSGMSSLKAGSVTYLPLLATTDILAPFPYRMMGNGEFLASIDDVPESRSSLIGRIFTNLVSKTVDEVAPRRETEERKGLDFWTLADYGLKGYNAIADKEISLVTERNDRGKVTEYSLVEEEGTLWNKKRDLSEE